MKISVTTKFEINPSFLSRLQDAKAKALEKTGDMLHSNLIMSQTMPFDTGMLQNESTFVNYEKSAEGVVSIVSSTPYARRLYFHPEYNFQRGKNPNAGGRWLDPYLAGGAKAHLAPNFFAEELKKQLGG